MKPGKDLGLVRDDEAFGTLRIELRYASEGQLRQVRHVPEAVGSGNSDHARLAGGCPGTSVQREGHCRAGGESHHGGPDRTPSRDVDAARASHGGRRY